jgi:hypothetical protein
MHTVCAFLYSMLIYERVQLESDSMLSIIKCSRAIDD